MAVRRSGTGAHLGASWNLSLTPFLHYEMSGGMPSTSKLPVPMTTDGRDSDNLMDEDTDSDMEGKAWTPVEMEVLQGAIDNWMDLEHQQDKKVAVRTLVQSLCDASPEIHKEGLNERVKQWLTRASRPRRRFTGGKRPSLREVLGFTWGDKIRAKVLSEFGVKPGEVAFVGKRAIVMSQMMKVLTGPERERFDRMADTWARTGPPRVKRRR